MVFILSVFIGITLGLAGAKPAVNYYATKYNHIDVEAILNNRRLVNYYSACLLSKGPCPPEGVEFKKILPEALRTNCGRCTEKQSTVALRAIKRLKKEYPKIWSQLSAQWDPDDIYVRKFESSFATKNGSPNPLQSVHRFDPGSSQPNDNTLDGDVSPTITASKLYSSTINQQDSTTHKVITSTNSISLSSLSTKATPPPPPTTPRTRVTLSATSSSRLFSSTSSTTTRRTTSSTTTRRTTTTRPPPIPGLLPLNTFFTNPPIPIRPIANLNIGANIGATVKAIKQVEKIVAGIALEKLDLIKNMFSRPWRGMRRKYT